METKRNKNEFRKIIPVSNFRIFSVRRIISCPKNYVEFFRVPKHIPCAKKYSCFNSNEFCKFRNAVKHLVFETWIFHGICWKSFYGYEIVFQHEIILTRKNSGHEVVFWIIFRTFILISFYLFPYYLYYLLMFILVFPFNLLFQLLFTYCIHFLVSLVLLVQFQVVVVY